MVQSAEALSLELVHDQTLEDGLRVIIPGTQSDLGPDGRNKYIENWNGTRRFLITPISESEIYLALTCLDDDLAGKSLSVDKSSWKTTFPRWSHLIDRIAGPVTWGSYSTVKVRSWSSGRTAIMGDAAHAQPPNLGHGGGMAMQMGLALAVHLEGIGDRRDIPDALQAWETQERPLVDHCQKWSCLYGEIAYLPDDSVIWWSTTPWPIPGFRHSSAAPQVASQPDGRHHRRRSSRPSADRDQRSRYLI